MSFASVTAAKCVRAVTKNVRYITSAPTATAKQQVALLAVAAVGIELSAHYSTTPYITVSW